MKITNVSRSRFVGATFLGLTILLGALFLANPTALAEEESPPVTNGEDLYVGLPSMDGLLAEGSLLPPNDLPEDFGSEQYLQRTYGTDFAGAHEVLLGAGAQGFTLDLGIMPFAIGHEPNQEMWHPITEIYHNGRRAAFGAVVNFSNLNPQIPAFCLDLNAGAPAGTTGTTVLQDASWLEQLAPYSPPQQYDLTPGEIAQLLTRYAQNDQADASYVAALGLLTHVNFELSADADTYVSAYLAAWESDVDGQALARQAVVNELVTWTRTNTVTNNSWVVPELVSMGQSDRGELTDIRVVSPAGNNISDLPFTATLTGPAVFDQTGTNQVSGKTDASSLAYSFTATDNGEVQASVQYTYNSSDMYYNTPDSAGIQRTIQSPGVSPVAKVITAPMPLAVAVDFQPLLVSNVDTAGSLITDSGSTVLRDHLVVFADPDYSNPLWLGNGPYRPGEDQYSALPVKFTGKIYRVGEEPIVEEESTGPVPAAASSEPSAPLGQVELIAEGPGEYSVELPLEAEPGFVTWVWSVDPDDQPHLSAEEKLLIAGPWSDGFAVAGEVTSIRWPGKIETNLKVHETNDATYLVDDVWISDLPSSHPDFGGGAGFEPDYPVIHQKLYFWPEGTPITEGSYEGATLIGETTVPAKNGFYPSQGSLEWKLKVDNGGEPVAGTYQVVHSFPGDDRVAPFTSPIPDPTEQHTVTAPAPKLGTNATNGDDSTKVVPGQGPVKIVDEVCYEGLTPGKEYVFDGILMDRTTGEPLWADESEVTSTAVHTPESADGCTQVVFQVDGEHLAGKTTVVFESLYLDGNLVAVHADIHDEKQTVTTSDTPTLRTTAKDSASGGNVIAPKKDVSVTDEVCYANLTAGKEYLLRGTLIDKSNGLPVQNDGQDVTGSAVFTPTEADGCTEVTFTFDGRSLKPMSSLVVFETLYLDDQVVAVHADINDEAQTVVVQTSGGSLPVTGGAMKLMAVVAAGSLAAGILFVAKRREI